MERCPTCQARLRGESVCGRCRTDLGLVLRAETLAATQLRAAIAHLAGGDEEAARRALEESLRLKRGPLALRLRDFLARMPDHSPALGTHPTGIYPGP